MVGDRDEFGHALAQCEALSFEQVLVALRVTASNADGQFVNVESIEAMNVKEKEGGENVPNENEREEEDERRPFFFW